MKTFPQELVDRVIDELYILVGNPLQDKSTLRRDSGSVTSISDYSLVSKAWVNPTQKHHFSILHLSPTTLDKWLAAPNTAGMSRYVRILSLSHLDPEIRQHLHAFTRIELLSVYECYNLLHHRTSMEWFPVIGSSLTELRITDTPVTPYTLTSLLATLPLLRTLDIRGFDNPYEVLGMDDDDEIYDDDDVDDTSTIQFFDGANRFILRAGFYLEDSLDWIPSSARFGQLELDVMFSQGHTADLVNQWLASSSTTLTYFAINMNPLGTSPPT